MPALARVQTKEVDTMARLDGKVAIVTGGASGIGKRTAEIFAEEGARVVIADINGAGVESLVNQLGPDRAEGIQFDIRDEEAVGQMVDLAFSRFGRLDIAFNNAGTGGFSPITQHSLTEWERVVGIVLTGTFLCIKHEALRLIGQGQGGTIINVASVNAVLPAEGFVAYCSAKAGVAMLTKMAALELGCHGIRVNGIGPGLIHTPLTAPLTNIPGLEDEFIRESPIGRIGEPEDVARLAVYLASDESSLMHGQTIYIDGGVTLRKYPELFRFLNM
jgi:NAD(P)-dependent dehydrogenase (short-subunit alcohol dehydrogenase family)